MFNKEEIESIKSKIVKKDFTIKVKKPEDCWIQTFTGKKFFPLNPNIDDIDIIDIARSLSHQCRFSGHIKHFYSVAQHAVYVSYLCDEKDANEGLNHDDSEGYIIDLPKPLKDSGYFDNFKEKENNLQKMIYKKFCNTEIEPPSVKIADMIMLSTEANCLLNNKHPDWTLPTEPINFKIEYMSPDVAQKFFLDRFYELNGK